MTAYAHLLAEPLGELRALTDRALDRDRARHVLHQATVLLEQTCVHDTRTAVARLRALALPATQRAFDEALLAIFAELGDRHTQAYLPDPFAGRVVFLPFLADEVRGRFLLIASAHDELERGDELVSWNGIPILDVIKQRLPEQFGRTARARRAQAVQMLTFRPLAWMPMPEPEVLVEVDGPRGRRRVTLEWQVVAENMARLAPYFGLADGHDFFVDGFRAGSITTPHGTFTHLRIASLDAHPNDIARIYSNALRDLPQDGIVIDLRRCERGIVASAEALLQLFAKSPVAPLRFQFRLTPMIRELVARSPGLESWRDHVQGAGRYSRPRPLSEIASSDWRYPGPAVVLTSGLTYSSSEMFAAGFQDHALGPIIGTASATAGGGASPWPQSTLHRLSARDDLRPCPEAPSFRIAVRRALRRDGRPIERVGVRPSLIYRRTIRDVFEGDAGLLEFATSLLAEKNRTG